MCILFSFSNWILFARRKTNEEGSSSGAGTDLEDGEAEAANVGFCRVFLLAKPDAGKLIIATTALLIASTTNLLILPHEIQAAAASIAEESFGAIRTVRSFAKEQYAISGYSEKVDETLKLGLRQAKVVGLFSGGLSAASTLSVIVVVIYGAYLAITGSMTASSLTSFILYSLTVGSSISSLSGLYTTAMKAAGASRRVFQLLDRVSSMSSSGDKCPISDPDGDVELDDVWFAYPSRPSHMVLKFIYDLFSLD
ncbi:hypothetical protein K7X08_013767 [Anisodus acutangulus]|uniref:ABC transmembrane type-1 domain-containing protein n=1 Tax=Anisodus acutangulus TaxID=402998 RepID=A0A9Q1R5K4_9SOLA|nr:hypothetical protein K7X08_013767 [Anisodus acutangulus]